jgi:hypothetical protein
MADVETVTMDDFRKACEDRLDDALQAGEGVEMRATAEVYQTPAGLTITRYAGGLLVAELDHSELGDDAKQKWIRVDFFPEGEPTLVHEEIITNGAIHNNTLKQSEHDKIAAQLSKYLTLVI